MQEDIPGKGVKRQLEILCNIYALYLLHKYVGDFLSTSCITPKQASLANEQLRSLYAQVCFWTLFYPLSYVIRLLIRNPWLVVRPVQMPLPLLMHLTTLITILVLFSAAMMEMCIQNSTTQHGRTLLMRQLYLMATSNTFDQCWSNSSGTPGSDWKMSENL